MIRRQGVICTGCGHGKFKAIMHGRAIYLFCYRCKKEYKIIYNPDFFSDSHGNFRLRLKPELIEKKENDILPSLKQGVSCEGEENEC